MGPKDLRVFLELFLARTIKAKKYHIVVDAQEQTRRRQHNKHLNMQNNYCYFHVSRIYISNNYSYEDVERTIDNRRYVAAIKTISLPVVRVRGY